MRNISLYDREVLKAKFTVEEVSNYMGDKYISTCWNPSHELQVDRSIEEFETYSAALAHMYESALMYAMAYRTTLNMRDGVIYDTV